MLFNIDMIFRWSTLTCPKSLSCSPCPPAAKATSCILIWRRLGSTPSLFRFLSLLCISPRSFSLCFSFFGHMFPHGGFPHHFVRSDHSFAHSPYYTIIHFQFTPTRSTSFKRATMLSKSFSSNNKQEPVQLVNGAAVDSSLTTQSSTKPGDVGWCF